jgi:hypothetical protein
MARVTAAKISRALGLRPSGLAGFCEDSIGPGANAPVGGQTGKERLKWVVGKAVRAGLALIKGRISESTRYRRATQPPAHFQRNPPGRGQLAVFPRCSLDPYDSDKLH